MVSFNCHRCGDVVKKPKVQTHAAQCGTTGYSCVDCMGNFDLASIQAHRECVSEVQKYQGKWQDKARQLPKAEGAPRPKFNAADFDDTDMDDDKPIVKSKPKACAQTERRGMAESDDDEVPAKKPAAVVHHTHKKAGSSSPVHKATAAHAVPTAGKKTTKSVTPKSSPKASPKVSASNGHGVVVRVEGFDLGPLPEVADMAASVVEVSGELSLALKTVAASLAADVYAKRIQKQLIAAITQALEGRGAVGGVKLVGKDLKLAKH
jgi:cell growth-regulating nucleolar protein